MPKLYYTPTSCGAANFIAAFKAGLKFDSEQVNLQTHLTASGVDFYTVNPNGNVPTLVLDDGTVLSENSAVLQYIADQAPASGLAPPAGTLARYQLINELSFIATELHQGVTRLFRPNSPEVTAANLEVAKQRLAKGEKHVAARLAAGKQFLLGDNFTVADSYLFIILSWFPYLKLSYDDYPALGAFYKGIAALDFVQAAQARIATSPATTTD